MQTLSDLTPTMTDRSIDMIFEPSGLPVPSEEEVQFEAREILQRSGWGLPLIERLRKIADPYWREALTRWLMGLWREMVRDKDEQTYYYDSDGDIRFCWQDAEYDFGRIIRRCTAEQVERENARTSPTGQNSAAPVPPTPQKQVVNVYIQQNYGPININSNVTLH